MDDRERRVLLEGLEVRAEGDDSPPQLVGYAAKFNVLSEEMWGFREQIAPGAFDRALKEKHDVRYLVDHDPTRILGRTKSGTARLAVDKVGLRAEVDLPDTQTGRDIRESVGRGDVSGMSFAFRVGVEEWNEKADPPVRTIKDVDLFDVSAVTYPAYPETEVSARALDKVKEITAPAPEPPPAPVERLTREMALIDRDEEA